MNIRINHSIPLLFATPDTNNVRLAFIYSMLTMALSACIYLASEIWPSFPFFGPMALIIGLHGCVSVISSRANLLYILRYFLVWILIFSTSLVWFVYSGKVFVAPFGVGYQTADNTRLLITAGAFSLCGSLMGWVFSLSKLEHRYHGAFLISERNKKYLRNAGVALAAGFALLYVWKTGGFIGDGETYLNKKAGFALTFGVFNVFQYIGISLLLISGIHDGYIKRRYLIVAIVTLFLGIMAGSRADYLPQTFIMIALLYNRQISGVLRRFQYTKMIKWCIYGILFLVIGYYLANFLAIWRQGVSPTEVLSTLFESHRGLLINNIYGHKMLYFETGNMMLGGLYSAIVHVKDNITGLLWGKSYYDYFLKAPPAFLGLPRPLGLEWFTGINGKVMSQGGIFEVAEAYWNFGLAGCFFVSFIISYAFAWLLGRGLRFNNYFYLTWYLVFGFMGFRAVWYQNFSYFRIMTIMLLIYVFTKIFFSWYVANRKPFVHHSYHFPTQCCRLK